MYKLITFVSFLILASCKNFNTEKSTTTNIQEPFSITLFKTGMEEGVHCYRIPSIVTAVNGDIIAAIDQRVPSCGDLNKSDDINIILRRSEDNGSTWSPIETVVDFPLGFSGSDPSMIVDQQTGTIFLFYNYMKYYEEKDIYYLHVTKSNDHGKTWSEPVDITSQISKPEWRNDFKFITSGRGIYTSTGQLLHTMVNLNNGLHVFGSDDHGETWNLKEASIMPADESKIVELSDGSLMINARVNKKGYRYIHRSNNQGISWETSSDENLKDPGCNASIIRYTSKAAGDDKDRLLFSNANSSEGRVNMTVKISYDEGETWSEGKTIYSGSSAYSSMTILKNGDIGLFYERDNHTTNEFVRFSLEWLTDGEDKIVK